jgi:hypothetical protein
MPHSAENYTTTEDIFKGYDISESPSITLVKGLILQSAMKTGLHNFKLCSHYHLCNSLPGSCSYTNVQLFTAPVGCQVSDRASTWQGDKARSKLKKAFSKIMVIQHYKINEILGGNEAQLADDKPALNSNDLAFFKYAPVMLHNVKRSFSCYKTILSENEMPFTSESFKIHVFIKCNPFNNAK